jgi:hypothetical protein
MHPQISCGRPKTMDVIGSRVTSPKNPKDHSTMNRRIVLNVAKRSLGGGGSDLSSIFPILRS